MVLAAGRGSRLRPLTDSCPKPLLEVGGETLLGRQLRQLAAAGLEQVLINTGWLGADIQRTYPAQLPASAGLPSLHYSDEGWPALETGGGIARALPWLAPDAFVICNADVYSEFPLARLLACAATLPAGRLAHLIMVANPDHNAEGDFALHGEQLAESGSPRLTYSGMAVLRPQLFRGCAPGAFPLAPLLRRAMAQGQVSGELYEGYWSDVGTPERLAQTRAWAASQADTAS